MASKKLAMPQRIMASQTTEGHKSILCSGFTTWDSCCTRACGLGSQCRPNECIFGSGKPRGVRISGKGPHGLGEGKGESVYEKPGNEVDGSCHSKEGSK